MDATRSYNIRTTYQFIERNNLSTTLHMHPLTTQYHPIFLMVINVELYYSCLAHPFSFLSFLAHKPMSLPFGMFNLSIDLMMILYPCHQLLGYVSHFTFIHLQVPNIINQATTSIKLSCFIIFYPNFEGVA